MTLIFLLIQMHSTLPSKFHFNQLVWPIYRRFVELLVPETTHFTFSLTNKKNCINTVKFNKINIYFLETNHGGIDFENLLILNITSDDDFLKHLKKMSKFIPYLSIGRLYINEYHIKVTRILLPKTYKKFHFLNVESIDHINHAANIYYHKDINFMEGHFKPHFTNEEWYSAINYAMNRMPVKQCKFKRMKNEKKHTVEDLLKVLQVPEVVKSITIEHQQNYLPYLCDEKWVVIIS